MTRTFKQRAFFTSAVTILTLALGAFGGYLLGCVVVVRAVSNDLEQDAQRIEERDQAYIKESYSLLQALNSSRQPDCSDQELADFRKIILRSEFIRDVGRVSHGRIDCSATMGRLATPILFPVGGHQEVFGSQSYLHVRRTPPVEENWDNHGILSGQHYVLVSNYIYAGLVPPPFRFIRNGAFIEQEAVLDTWGIVPDVDLRLLDHSSTFVRNRFLYATRCSAGRPSCSTVFTSLQSAMQGGKAQVVICALAGGLVGLLLGIYCSIIYRRSLSMRSQLRRAIQKDAVQVLYQPIIELSSGRMVEAEALARWTDEDGFAVSPAVFVATAEEDGFIGELTELVVRHVLHDLRDLLQIDPNFQININVTATDLADERFPLMLEDSLAKAGVAARSLAIEVTESSTVKAGTARETIRQLRDRGHSVQIDDFGTGYSSLSYLDELSIDAIKIDRAFTQGICTKSVTASILPQILAMARTLNLQVIVEGIEVPEQAAYFAGSEMNILGQGWLFGRPMKASDLCLMLAQATDRAIN